LTVTFDVGFSGDGRLIRFFTTSKIIVDVPITVKPSRQGAPIPRDSDLRKVNPYFDPADGIHEVNGRLEHAPLAESARHPVIISPDHHLATLIINQAHVDAHHAGVENMNAKIQTKGRIAGSSCSHSDVITK
jgi:hypothetical protein